MARKYTQRRLDHKRLVKTMFGDPGQWDVHRAIIKTPNYSVSRWTETDQGSLRVSYTFHMVEVKFDIVYHMLSEGFSIYMDVSIGIRKSHLNVSKTLQELIAENWHGAVENPLLEESQIAE